MTRSRPRGAMKAKIDEMRAAIRRKNGDVSSP